MSGNNNDGKYAVDIRVLIFVIAMTMAGSFMAGVLNAGSNAIAASSSVHQQQQQQQQRNLVNENEETTTTTTTTSAYVTMDDAGKDAPPDHRPAGQHLLVDIKGVDTAFLNSEARLAAAMVDTVKESGLTMLSYHCHALLPSGVSCVGVLLESHISFHTWPEEGVITLDLFTCGDKPLLPAVQTIERLFGIGDDTHTQWSHELRGFRDTAELKRNYLADSSDLGLWVLSPLDMHYKKQIYSGETAYQRIDIWDIVEINDTPGYDDIMKHNMTPGDPRLLGPEFVSPDRLLFLDGTLQSLKSSERIYHEALVHPNMFSHPNPKTVAILGGGEGATLREVLKHNTLQSVTMIEIDEVLVKVSRELLPEFSDCSDLVGRADNCFDDELSNVVFDDGRQYFIDRYGDNRQETNKAKDVDAFDVVIVDALDPEEGNEISDMLYSDQAFVDALVTSLSDDGVLVIQVGTAATIDDPRPYFGIYKNRELLFQMLENNDKVEAMFVYEEPNCGFLEPHAFIMVCRNAECRSRWYARPDQVDYAIYDRMVRTKTSATQALIFFDGMTQRSYQWPKRGWETVYCRREPQPFECQFRSIDAHAEIHDYDLENPEAGSFRIESHEGDNGELESKVFATKLIPKGSFIMAQHLASSLQITTRNLEGLQNNVEVGKATTGQRVAVIEDVLEYFDEYGHASTAAGSHQHYIEVGASVLIRRVADSSASNIAKWVPNGNRPNYSPVYERHRVSFDVFVVATEDIAVGDEILAHVDMW